ncbi:glycosyltransferase family 2 protein [Agarivorans aestuarii]|uniref:Glycosyltransferase family 2 protein n=1 Tax=Agarivorans aestuarii TaxID=1563703 RepID=A0ABU7G0D0_9ALTE|nr:glycosyltransferase family 2 protein [Agarivorans aestuarii]MEE1672809.1 glycosyltransferase family 2 protein [Agarivorans aestuarii]
MRNARKIFSRNVLGTDFYNDCELGVVVNKHLEGDQNENLQHGYKEQSTTVSRYSYCLSFIENSILSINNTNSLKAYKQTIREVTEIIDEKSTYNLERICDLLRSFITVALFDQRSANYLDSIYVIALKSGLEEYLYKVISREGLRYFKHHYKKSKVNIRTLSKIFSLTGSGFKNIKDLKGVVDYETYITVLYSTISGVSDAKEWLKDFDFSVDELYDDNALVESIYRSPSKMVYLPDVNGLSKYLYKVKGASNNFKVLLILNLIKDDYSCPVANDSLLETIFSLHSDEIKSLFLHIRRLQVSDKVAISFNSLFKRVGKKEYKEFSKEKKYLFLKLFGPIVSSGDLRDFLGAKRTVSQECLATSSLLGLNVYSLSLVRRLMIKKGINPILPISASSNVNDYFKKTLLTFEASNNSVSGFKENLVSIIITTFSPDIELMELSIRSLLCQTHKKIEVIVVDDCSPLEVSELIVRKLKSINWQGVSYTYIRNDSNIGQYLSRNKAIKLARGDVIAIQDDDDISHPSRLEKQLEQIDFGNLACFTKHIRFDSVLNISVDDRDELSVYGDGPATLMCRKDILVQLEGFRDFRSRGDIDFRERLFKVCGEELVEYINEPLYYMKASMSSVSSVYEYFHGDKLSYYRDVINHRRY